MIDLHSRNPARITGGAAGPKTERAFDAAVAAPASVPQHEMQQLLAAVHESGGLEAAMEALFLWSRRTGYLTAEKLESNGHYSYYDADLEIEYRVQINIARAAYTPKPVNAGGLPPVHCAICRENAGRPGKELLRIYEFALPVTKRQYFLQLTPFPVFPYHFVLISRDPEPMHVDRTAVEDMISFAEAAPGYTVCSNSDVEGAGSSILEHHHFQVFKGLRLPAMTAGAKRTHRYGGLRIEYLDYDLAAVRITAEDAAVLIGGASPVIEYWKGLAAGNTGNLILRRECGQWTLIVFFRNPGRQTPQELLRIKSEGIGIIEAAGAAILPPPGGGGAEKLSEEIRRDGKKIIKGILSGINPVTEAEETGLWKEIISRVGGPESGEGHEREI